MSQNVEIVRLEVVLVKSSIWYSFNSQVNDLTQEVSEFRREVSSVLEHPISEDSAFIKSYLDDKPLTRDSAVQLLVDKLSGREIERSILLVRAFREKLDGEAFGSSDEDNLDCLVSFYCKQVAEKNVGSGHVRPVTDLRVVMQGSDGSQRCYSCRRWGFKLLAWIPLDSLLLMLYAPCWEGSLVFPRIFFVSWFPMFRRCFSRSAQRYLQLNDMSSQFVRLVEMGRNKLFVLAHRCRGRNSVRLFRVSKCIV